MKPGVYFAAD